MTERHATEPSASIQPILRVSGLKVHFPIRKGILRRPAGYIKAVDGVDLHLSPGETLGLVGESGCGKSTLGQAIMRLIRATAGQVHLCLGDEEHEILTANRGIMARVRRDIQMVFQDPYSSMNPRMTVFDVVAEPLVINRVARGRELERRVYDLLAAVGLNPAQARRYPTAFSGGQRQRMVIARALALRPKVVIADEPVSALDVSVQAQILNLLNDLKKEFGLTYLFIAHNLDVVNFMSQRIAVMYLGRIVEIGPAETVYQKPRHPYTESLLAAIPAADPELQRRKRARLLQGDVPDPANPPAGCPFHTRCPHAIVQCRTQVPALEDQGDGRSVACHLSQSLDLAGGKVYALANH